MDTIPDTCVVLDTETTGFSYDEGDRLVEIGAVRMRNGLPTKETFHVYINPQRAVPPAAVEVHGLTTEFLSDKPHFADVVGPLLDFIGDDPIAAHNAAFDAGFLNAELTAHGKPAFEDGRFIDTVAVAKKKLPGTKVNLDALCKRFRISLDSREKHGALIDSQLLAEVIVELNGGRQSTLFGALDSTRAEEQEDIATPMDAPRTRIVRASAEEKARHRAMLARLGQRPKWYDILEEDPADITDAA